MRGISRTPEPRWCPRSPRRPAAPREPRKRGRRDAVVMLVAAWMQVPTGGSQARRHGRDCRFAWTLRSRGTARTRPLGLDAGGEIGRTECDHPSRIDSLAAACSPNGKKKAPAAGDYPMRGPHRGPGSRSPVVEHAVARSSSSHFAWQSVRQTFLPDVLARLDGPAPALQFAAQIPNGQRSSADDQSASG